MFSRRQFLTRTLQGSSLVALGGAVPQFVARTAHAAKAGKDNVLVVVQMSGGNDGLNTVIPVGNDEYHKARPTLRYTREQVIKVNDDLGLNPGMRGLEPLLQAGNLAIVQGVGYPNPNRSHFESMDIWHTADPRLRIQTGWLGRTAPELKVRKGIPILHLGGGRLPLALKGALGSAVSVKDTQSYQLNLGGGSRHKARRKLLDELTQPSRESKDSGLLNFVQRRQTEMLTTIDELKEVLSSTSNRRFLRRGDGRFAPYGRGSLPHQLQLVAELIKKGFGTRVFYVSISGFDTHSRQKDEHRTLLAALADGIGEFYRTLKEAGHDKRVRVMTFSEFGRRVRENGSKGTDHGAASCMFVAGPSVKGGVVGKHPSLKELDAGDLKYHTDFRQVYATLLDNWLDCDSKTVLGGKFGHLKALV